MSSARSRGGAAGREPFHPRPLRSRRVATALFVVWMWGTQSSGAQPAAGGGLELEEALRVTLERSPDIRRADRQVEVTDGIATAARAPFDLLLESSASGERLHRDNALIRHDVAYSLGLERTFRNGVQVSSSAALLRSRLPEASAPAADNSAAVAVSAAVPLLQDRGGAVIQAAEQSAGRRAEGARLERQHVVALRMLASALAYWDYVAAHERLAVLVASEERAKRTADVTRELVRADERTSADLTQLLGNLAAKRVARIAGEQAVVESREQLGLAMGLGAGAAGVVDHPATGFPTPLEGASLADPERLAAEAHSRRADAAAAAKDVEASRIAVRAARNEGQPRLDLVLGSRYQASGVGSGLGDFLRPLYRPEPALDASVRLAFRFPPVRSSARGRLQSNAAIEAQNEIAQEDLRRRIVSAVRVAVDAVQKGRQSVAESEEAVRLIDAGARAEERKFQLGASTLFDTIQAQDALTSALLARIQSRRGYAVALASLRFQSGTLLEMGSHPDAKDAAGRLLVPE